MKLSSTRQRRLLAIAGLAATLVTLSACGSTVATSGLSSSGGNGSQSTSADGLNDGLGDGLTGGSDAGATPQATAGASTGGTDAGATTSDPTDAASTDPGTSVDSGAGGSATSGSGSNGTTSIPLTGKGWDKDYLYIGITNQSDVASAAHALGLKLDPGNVVEDVNAVVNDINAKGGVFGRKVKALIKDNSTVSLQANREGGAQAACTYFTQDHKVMGVINIATLLDTESFRGCMQKTKTPLMSVSVEPVDDTVYKTYAPYYFGAIAPSFNTMLPTLMTRLKAQGYFKGWNSSTGAVSSAPVKVGILYGFTNAQHRIGALMKKTAQAAGYTVAAEYSYGEQEKNLNPAVLRFKAAGVTHVFSDGLAVGQFMINANGQGYKPRYALTSYSGMQAALEENAPKAQMVGAVGIGWMPAFDTSFAKDPGYVGKGSKECADIMKKAGIKFNARFAQLVGQAICDGFHMIVDGAKQGGTLESFGVIDGLKAIGPNFRQSISFGSGLSKTSTQMPGSVRDISWNTQCSCFAYSGSTYRM